ncbi:MAG: hypothetical protein AAF721_40765 [Myxococcota bacterium]
MSRVTRQRLVAALLAAQGCFTDSDPVAGNDGGASASSSSGTAPDDAGTGTNPGGSSGEPDSSGANGVSSGEPGESCDDDQYCVPMAPPEWDGPFVVAFAPYDAPPLMCPPGWDPIHQLNHGLVLGDAMCGCECGTTTDAVFCEYTVTTHLMCGAVEATFSTDSTDCLSLENSVGAVTVAVEGAPSALECDAGVVTGAIEESSWDSQVAACFREAEGPTCAMGSCWPRPPPGFPAEACISAVGDVPCPAGPFADKRVAFEGLDDQRSCACECQATAEGACDDSEWRGHDNLSCGGMPLETGPVDDQCQPIDAPAIAVRPVQPVLPCSPVDDTTRPVGEVQLLGARTFCCAQG